MTVAAALHGNQRQKGTQIPYISHLMSGSALVMEFGGDEDRAIAALLHDVLEDVAAEPDALLVSLADKVHNARAILIDVRTIGTAVYDRFKAGREGTLWYYAALSEAFSRLLPGPFAEELARTVEALRAIG